MNSFFNPLTMLVLFLIAFAYAVYRFEKNWKAKNTLPQRASGWLKDTATTLRDKGADMSPDERLSYYRNMRTVALVPGIVIAAIVCVVAPVPIVWFIVLLSLWRYVKFVTEASSEGIEEAKLQSYHSKFRG